MDGRRPEESVGLPICKCELLASLPNNVYWEMEGLLECWLDECWSRASSIMAGNHGREREKSP